MYRLNPSQSSLGSKTDSQNAVINIGEWDFLLDNSQELAMRQPKFSALGFALGRCFPSLEAILG